MTRHGLWVVHRHWRSRCIRWWDAAEGARCSELALMSRPIYRTPASHIVLACAARYVRRYPHVVRNVRDYNDLIYRIARRVNFAEPSTVRACWIDNARPNTLICLKTDTAGKPYVAPVRFAYEIYARAKGLRGAKAAREAKEAKARERAYQRVLTLQEDARAIRRAINAAKAAIKKAKSHEDQGHPQHAL